MEKEILEKIKPGAMVLVRDKFGAFQGMVIARKHGREAGATFTVRTNAAGVGLEKIYPLHSPNIKIKILSSPKKIRRAKLYFLRKLSKKKIRQKIGGTM